MATSYTNKGGTGWRASLILTRLVQVGGTVWSGNVITLINGAIVNGEGNWNTIAAPAGTYVEWWFSSAKVIDEAKYYQSATTSQGTWKFQGSNDRVNWTDIGSTFTLGGATTQTITTLNGNTTAYCFYRMIMTAGSLSNTPWVQEIEFKIDEGTDTTSYENPAGRGPRIDEMNVTQSGFTLNGSIESLVDGQIAGGVFWSATTAAGKYITFDFLTPRVVQQARWFQQTADTHGVWKWQVSNDNSSWSDLGSSFTLGDDITVNSAAPWATATGVAILGDISANTTAYRYYRLIGVSGNVNGSPFLHEVEFKIDDGELALGGGTPTYAVVSGSEVAVRNTNSTTDSPRPIAIGDLCVVTVRGAQGGENITLTDLAGNTFKRLIHNLNQYTFYCVATAAHANNIYTISSGLSFQGIAVCCFSNSNGWHPDDVLRAVQAHIQGTTTPTILNFNTYQRDLLLVMLCNSDAATNGWTAGTGFTEAIEDSDQVQMIQYRTLSGKAVDATFLANSIANNTKYVVLAAFGNPLIEEGSSAEVTVPFA